MHKPAPNSPEKYQTLDELMEREEASAIKIESNPASKKIGFFKRTFEKFMFWVGNED